MKIAPCGIALITACLTIATKSSSQNISEIRQRTQRIEAAQNQIDTSLDHTQLNITSGTGTQPGTPTPSPTTTPTSDAASTQASAVAGILAKITGSPSLSPNIAGSFSGTSRSWLVNGELLTSQTTPYQDIPSNAAALFNPENSALALLFKSSKILSFFDTSNTISFNFNLADKILPTDTTNKNTSNSWIVGGSFEIEHLVFNDILSAYGGINYYGVLTNTADFNTYFASGSVKTFTFANIGLRALFNEAYIIDVNTLIQSPQMHSLYRGSSSDWESLIFKISYKKTLN
jgi:hypothetical protein